MKRTIRVFAERSQDGLTIVYDNNTLVYVEPRGSCTMINDPAVAESIRTGENPCYVEMTIPQ